MVGDDPFQQKFQFLEALPTFFQNYWIAIKILNPLTYFIGNQQKK